MNYAMARERDDGSGWHFTVKNDDRVWPHECCRIVGPPATQDDADKYGYLLGEPTVGKPHAPHATREEAVACFNRWRRRPEHVHLDAAYSDWTGCRVCDAPTKRGARIRDIGSPDYYPLCDEHRTVEHALAQVKDVDTVTYS